MRYEVTAEVWLWDGQGAWHFITLPEEIGAEIKELFGSDRPGWGAVPVEVKIGETKWKTSVFPDKKSGSYLLPLKAEIRKKTGLSASDKTKLSINILT